MPKISVVIEYDTPDDPLWLNPDNVAVALSSYCKNTHFSVQWASGGNPWANPEDSCTQSTAANSDYEAALWEKLLEVGQKNGLLDNAPSVEITRGRLNAALKAVRHCS